MSLDFCQTGELRSVLNLHGLKADCGGFSSLGSTSVHLTGTLEDAFRARDLILKNVAERGWKVAWPADYIILPDDPRWKEAARIAPNSPKWVRLASIRFRETPTIRIVKRLRREEIPFEMYFGDPTDTVAVSPSDFARARSLLEGYAYAGVNLAPP